MTLCIGIYEIDLIYGDDPICIGELNVNDWYEFAEIMDNTNVECACLTWEKIL